MSNNSSSNFLNASDLCVGVSYLIISLLLITLNMTCSYFLITEKHRSSQSFYRIAFDMAVADTIQLIFNGIPATLMILDIISDTFYWFNNICSALLASGWMASIFQAHLLAFNRYIHMFYQYKIEMIFSRRKTRAMLSVTWTLAAVWFLLISNPIFNLLFTKTRYSYRYNEFDATRYVLFIQTFSNLFNIIGMALWYTLIYREIRKKRTEIRNVVISANKIKERKMLLQAALLCAATTVSITSFSACQYISLPRYLNVASNIVWLLAAGSNSIVHLTLNNKMRGRFLQAIGRSKTAPATVTAWRTNTRYTTTTNTAI